MLERRSLADAESSAVTAQVGDVIYGKYQIERVIGEGGMGVVVAAKHLTLDRSVALKLLSPKSRESQEAIERFTREARAAAKIQSEHVGRVLDVDALPNGTPFIVMELLEGHDLAEELRRLNRLPPDRAVGIVLEACEAVAEAHSSGIVHRDLKPANLFLSKASTGNVVVKVLDFGISKITRREEASTTDDKALTNAGSMLGSPLYMSPEQMQASAEVDARTDIWSLGVILYELLTGKSPFDANTVPMICASVLSQPPPPFTVELPEGLDRVVLRCLEKDPPKRFRDVAHLVRALAPFAPEQAKITIERINKLRDEHGAPAASPASLPPPPNKEGSLTITNWGTKSASIPKRRVWPLAVAGGVALVILGLVALRLASGPDASATAAPTPTAAATGDRAPVPGGTTVTPETAAPVNPTTSSASAPPELTSEPVASASSASPGPGVSGTARKNPNWRPPPKSSGGRTSGFGGRE